MSDNNLSGYDVETRATELGYKITQSYINKIRNAQAGNISVIKQKALAAGIGVLYQQIADIVNEETDVDASKLKQITFLFSELDENRQKDLLDIAKLYYSQKTVTLENSGENSDVTPRNEPFVVLPEHNQKAVKEVPDIKKRTVS